MKKILFLLFVLTCKISLNGQQDKPVIKNLVFEGAGIRGIAYCGALKQLESANMMQRVERVGGTSAGAIVALAVSLGYTSAEISEIISNTSFKKFNDGRFLFPGGINRVHKYFGWYRGMKFEKWLEKMIADKTGNADISFRELNKKGFKDLYVTGTCLNKQQLVIFSRNNYPDMKIKDAVRISMSVPLYFEAVFINKEGRVIRHPKEKEGLDIMVDGGFTGNFPIRIFDSPTQFNNETLGFRIDSDAQIKNDRAEKTLATMPVGSLKQYINAFYNMVIENLNRQQLNDEDWKRTVSISDGLIGPRIRKLSNDEVARLISNGEQAMKQYLQ